MHFSSQYTQNALYATSTYGQSSIFGKTSQKPLIQQIDLHLQDVDIQRHSVQRPPAGKVIVHIGDGPGIEVEFYSRELVKKLRERIESTTKVSMKGFTLACKNGTMIDEFGLDEYGIVSQMHIVAFESGERVKAEKRARDWWLQNRETSSKKSDLKYLKEIIAPKKLKIKVMQKQKEMTTFSSVKTFLNNVKLDFI